jgi:DNA-binding response OmpR family regulator
MGAPTILIVDDEPPIVDLVRGYLEREGYTVHAVADGPAAVVAVRDLLPDVVVLDVMLPGFDGVEVCRRIRAFSDAYVIMLTARSEEIDRIVGLAVGADDYMAKPFSPRELVARVKALLRRPRSVDGDAETLAPGTARSHEAAPAPPGHIGPALPARGAGGPPPARGRLPAGIAVDPARRSVTVDDEQVALTTTEFDILALLARDPGVVVTRQGLLDGVWGDDFVGDDHLVDVHVGNLRRKLGDDPGRPRFVETVRGVGYRLREGA